MAKLKILVAALSIIASSAWSLCVTAEETEKSLTEIENSLDPLEFINNYDGVRRSVDLNILFAFNSDQLLEEARGQLQALGDAMKGERLASYGFKIIGHTDAVGTADYNRELSLSRAQSVKAYLIESFSISAERLEAVGKGESELIDSLPEDSSSHRRVEIQAFVLNPQAVSEENENKQDSSNKIEW